MNHRLRGALTSSGLTSARLAERVGVDAKSVERWITQDRLPHARTRIKVASVLSSDETYLWPQLLQGDLAAGATASEIRQIWPTRVAVPGDVWAGLIDQARKRIDVLVMSGGFLVEAFPFVEAVRRVSDAGGQVRVLLGDPASEQVRQRGIDEGLPTLPARAASTRDYLSSVVGLPGVEIRLHATPLYVSLYRFDQVLLANPHTHGSAANMNPVMMLQQVQGGALWQHYDAAFNRVWDEARSS